MNGMEQFVYKGNQKLRIGYTTGSCAAAAAKAAAMMLVTGEEVSHISLMTPKGILLKLSIEEIQRSKDRVRCAVRKDAGDDPDCTNGVLVFAEVVRAEEGIALRGGEGVGRVTHAGLEQPVGEAAINRVPRQMIRSAVQDVIETCSYDGGIQVTISVPGGEEIAKKTFNPQLGIEGGISILGTSGIVEPMSEDAILGTIHTEMKMKLHDGRKHLLITPGNYGRDFAYDQWGIELETGVKCSNYIGQTIDMAYEFQLEHMLLVGHIGKLVKVAAGIMNTHSRNADGRMEVLCAAAVMAGADQVKCRQILKCITTDEALLLLKEWEILDACMDYVTQRIYERVNRRAWDGLQVEVIVFSKEFGILGQTPGARTELEHIREQGK